MLGTPCFQYNIHFRLFYGHVVKQTLLINLTILPPNSSSCCDTLLRMPGWSEISKRSCAIVPRRNIPRNKIEDNSLASILAPHAARLVFFGELPWVLNYCGECRPAGTFNDYFTSFGQMMLLKRERGPGAPARDSVLTNTLQKTSKKRLICSFPN